MTLLLDQNLSRRLLPELEVNFPGARHVQAVGLEQASDVEIWAYATAHGLHVVTKDVDFAELALLRGYPPKVIWLNCGNISNAALRRTLLDATSAIRDFLAAAGEGVLEIE